jgi:hypothetical protein
LTLELTRSARANATIFFAGLSILASLPVGFAVFGAAFDADLDVVVLAAVLCAVLLEVFGVVLRVV